MFFLLYIFPDLPDQGGPLINGNSMRYQIGDTVRINCTSYRSRPAAKLAWFINQEPISDGVCRAFENNSLAVNKIQRLYIYLY